MDKLGNKIMLIRICNRLVKKEKNLRVRWKRPKYLRVLFFVESSYVGNDWEINSTNIRIYNIIRIRVFFIDFSMFFFPGHRVNEIIRIELRSRIS